VAVDEDFKGKHRDACLCYRCAEFTIMNDDGTFKEESDEVRANNCIIANDHYQFVVEYGLVAPITECPIECFKERK
jgi:hypothetical protein